MWIFITSISYFLNALALLVDKFLLRGSIPHPAVYTFYVNVLGLFAFLLLPLGFSWPGQGLFLVALGSGLASTLALFLFFSALSDGEASRVSPLLGGLVPVFVFFLAWLFLGEALAFKQIISFVVIVFGSYFILFQKDKTKTISKKVILWSVTSAFFFALSHTLAKYLYGEHLFSSGFIWRAVGAFVGALILIIYSKTRKEIFGSFDGISQKTGLFFISGQLAGALAFLLLNYAFTLGSVALTNALSGIQHIFVFLFAILLAKKHPNILGESLVPAVIFRKSLSILLIGVGIFILFI